MKTKRVAFCLIGAAVVLGLGVVHAAIVRRKPPPAIRLVSLRVENFDQDAKVRCQLTELTFLLPPSSKRLLGIDDDACRVTAFVDDTGTSLAMPKGALFSLDRIDGRDFLNVASFKSPTCGAKQITLTARVTVSAATAEKEIRRRLDLKPGAELPEESLDIRVKQVQDVSLGDVRTVFVVQSERKAGSHKLSIGDRRVGSLRFLDSAGKPIEFEQMGYKSDSSPDHTTTEITYGLYKRVASVTVETRVVDQVEPVVYDIDVRTGLGI